MACEIFLDQGLNPCPLHWQAGSHPLSHQQSPVIMFYICSLLNYEFLLDREVNFGDLFAQRSPSIWEENINTQLVMCKYLLLFHRCELWFCGVGDGSCYCLKAEVAWNSLSLHQLPLDAANVLLDQSSMVVASDSSASLFVLLEGQIPAASYSTIFPVLTIYMAFMNRWCPSCDHFIVEQISLFFCI